MYSAIQDIETEAFHFDYLLAAVAALMWFRLLFMLELNFWIGPLIGIIVSMTFDLFKFILLFGVQLIAFTCVGMLCFTEIPDYHTAHSTVLMLFLSTMGAFDLSKYETYYGDGTNKYYFGIIFHVVFILLNMVIILNVLIAIMATTYGMFEQF